jgi:hypothetical protein
MNDAFFFRYALSGCKGILLLAPKEKVMIRYVIDGARKAFSTLFVPKGPSSFHELRVTGLLLAGLFFFCGSAAYAGTATGKHAAANYGKIPLSFEPNRGQTDASVQFLSRGSGYSLFLTKDEVVLNLERQQAAALGEKPAAPSPDTLRMKLMGASANSIVTGLDPQSGTVSYLIGNDPKKWHTGIQTYGKVNFAQVYPGVDLVFYGNQRQLEYDFVVAAGADASRIAWQIDGAKPTIDADGNLVLSAANGPAGFKKPVLYQMDGDKKVAVEGAFTVAGNRIGFQLGSYDHAKALIIDPVLTYATYLGGSTSDYLGGAQSIGIEGLNGTGNVDQGIAFDSQGSAYVVGVTYSTDFPVLNPALNAPAKANNSSGYPSAVITKFSPDGSSLVYSTYLGGSIQDYGEAIAVDANGEAFVVGQTHSPDFPITSGAYQTICSPQDDGYHNNQEDSSCGASGYGNGSAFVTKLNASGSGLVYSTFFGGYGTVNANAIAIDGVGRAYIGGSASFAGCKGVDPTTGEIPYPYTCFPTTGSALVSGQAPENGHIGFSGFVAVFDPTGANLLYSSLFNSLDPNCSTWSAPNYLCGFNLSGVNGVAVDASGNFYIVGETNTTSLPTTTGVIQPTSGPVDSAKPLVFASSVQRGFVAKFTPVTTSGGALLAYATYLGGKIAGGSDMVSNITTDADGYAYVTGITASRDFPVTKGAYQTTVDTWAPWGDTGLTVMREGAAFVAKLNPTGTNIEWATYLGDITGNHDGVGAMGPIQLDSKGNVYVTGTTGGNFPFVGNMEPYQGAPVFVSEFDPTGSKILFATEFGTGLSDNMTPAGLAVDSAGNMYLAMDDNCAGSIVTPGSFQQTNHMQSSGCSEFSTTGFVAKISATGTATVALAASPSSAYAGQTVRLTATVTPTATYASVPTGTIQFEDGSTALGAAVKLNATGKAIYTSSLLASGTHSLKAVYSGDSTYPAAHGDVSLNILFKTATTLSITPSSSFYEEKVTLTANVSSSGGSIPNGEKVSFYNGTAWLGTGTLSGGTAKFATTALALGTHSITAVYSSDTNFAGSTSAAIKQVVSKATTTTALTSSKNPSVYGQSVNLVAAVSGQYSGVATGTVKFSNGSTILGSVSLNSSGKAALTTTALSVGTKTITAVYGGDANFASSTSNKVSQVVSKATTTAKLTSSVNPTRYSQSVTFTAKVTGQFGGTATGTVTFKDGTTALKSVSLSGGAATFATTALASGTHAITAAYSGDANFAGGTSNAVSQVVGKAATTTALTSSLNPSGFGQSVKLTAAVTGQYGGTATGTVTFSNGGKSLGSATLSGGKAVLTTTALPAGTDSITAAYGGDTNFSGSKSSALSQVVKAGAALTSPKQGAAFTSASQKFIWTTPTGATSYSLLVGSTGPGSGNLYYKDTQADTLTANNLPVNGETLYVRLRTSFNGVVTYNDYTFTAFTKK